LLAGSAGAKGSSDPAVADQLLAKIEEISKIFWETKASGTVGRHLRSLVCRDMPTPRYVVAGRSAIVVLLVADHEGNN